MKFLRFAAVLATAFPSAAGLSAAPLTLREDPAGERISVHRAGAAEPLVTQNAPVAARPYLHPLAAPDGRGVLTELSPNGRPHETGIFWGLTRVNGRDFFRHRGAEHWRRVARRIDAGAGETVSWTVEYDMLGAGGEPLLRETQRWSARDAGGRLLLDVEWTARALSAVTIGADESGGLFLRTPGRAGMAGAVVNSNRQRNERANGQRAVWIDVGLRLDGRDDPVHLAVFDHPKKNGYPLTWQVDAGFGVGPNRAAQGEWKIARGEHATFRHRLMAYTGAFDDVRIDEAWRAYTGERSDSVLWNIARAEGKKAVFLTGEQAVAKMTVPAGFEVKLAAAEPAIEQPMAFCWDDRGRLWVAENRDYETRKTGFSASGDSRIVILEDTDGDGKMDMRKVFLEGVPFPAALAVGFDGLWLGAPPNLLFVPDRDRDDRADAEIEVRLTGWGIQDRHETINSLAWGPDGWLYGCQGYATRSQVGKPAGAGRLYRHGEAFPEQPAVREPQYLDGGVWRYHPTKDRFEVVAHGFSNPWGLDFDDHGQMFITACVIPHLWHVVPGGIYHRQGGTHINPHVYADIRTIADHRHRSAHGGARIYLADEFPREYRGRIFMANIHEHALLTDILEPKGSGFVGHHGDDTLLANDPQWVGFSVEVGPDGAVYVLDWHDADICGITVNDKGTGRIYRLAPQGLPGRTGLNLAALGDRELVELQLHRNDWYVRRARLQLQQRAAAGRLDAGVAPQLRAIFAAAATTPQKLRALWALHVTGNLPEAALRPLLEHPAPEVRGWAVRLLGEDRAPGDAAIRDFARLALRDPSPVVRLEVAAVLQRLAPADRWALAEGLVAHPGDADDHNLPKLIWYGVEPLVPLAPERALALAAASEIPLVTRFIARRATVDNQAEAVAAAIGAANRPAAQLALLEGLRDGVRSLGRRETTAPRNWAAVEAALAAGADAARREVLAQVGQLFGDARAAAAQLSVLQDPAAATDRRREALAAFARDAYAPALPVAVALLDDPGLRREAIRALAAFDSPRVAPALLQRFSGWPAAERADAVLTLAARKPTAEALLAALRSGSVPRRDVSAYAARQLQRVLGPGFVDFWGPISPPAADRQREMAKLKRALTDDVLARASVAQGRAVFERICAACHQLYGQGGNIGPDLTGSNRANLDYILTEILNPSDVIQENYRLTTVTTRDGRTLAGNVAAEDDRQITLRLIGQDTTVAKADVLARETSPVSMMPEGLLQGLTDVETRDLIAYLRTSAQVPLPAP